MQWMRDRKGKIHCLSSGGSAVKAKERKKMWAAKGSVSGELETVSGR